MKRLIILTTIAILSPLSALVGCAPPATLVQSEPVKVRAYSLTRKLQIYWVNEIVKTTDTLFPRSRMGTFRELLMGKESIQLQRPHGVHVDYKGRIYVSDPDIHQVHLFDVPAGEHRIIRSNAQREFISPLGLASDEADNLYITDSASGLLYRYHIAEDRLERFPSPAFKRPTGIAFDSYLQRLFVVDTLAHQIIALDMAGKELFRFGSRGEQNGQFNYPTDVAIDRVGRVLVNDTLNSRIQIFKPSGKFLLSFGEIGDAPGTFVRAKGIATDSSGAIYVSDALTDMIQVFDFSGKYLASFGQSGQGRGEFWMPFGLFIDQGDRLYVADGYNQRVQIFEGLSFDSKETRSDTP